MEDELFDAAADLLASASLGKETDTDKTRDTPLELGREIDPKDPNPLTLRRRFDDADEQKPVVPARRATDAAPSPGTGSALVPSSARPLSSSNDMGWRDIISDMSRDETGATPDREDIADELIQRLRSDRDLQALAREFISLEEEDALNALEQTQKTSRNASPRLAAYLLLDAAAGVGN